MEILSRLQPFIADSDAGPDTVLYLKGFKGKEEIEFFMERLMSVSFTRETDNVEALTTKEGEDG